MGKDSGDDRRAIEKQRHEANRMAQFVALMICAVGFFNGLLYWERGSRIALGVVVLCVVALIGWVLYSRRIVRELR